VRAPSERVDEQLQQFYEGLLPVLRLPVVRDGQWRLLECAPAWDGNWTAECILAFAWERSAAERLLIAVNYASNPSQCYVPWPFPDLSGRTLQERNGADLSARGLFLDLPAWGYHAFTLA
jgi:hypothetical protein